METIIAFIGGMLLSAATLSIFETWIKKLVRALNQSVDEPWHNYNETPENNTHVLVYNDGHYHVAFYRDAMYDFYGNYFTNRVDRWMYIPGNTAKNE